LELELLDHLFKLGDGRDYRPDWFGLAPVRIAASLCHNLKMSCLLRGFCVQPAPQKFLDMNGFETATDFHLAK
jgi:hypothetical protein